jgi:hypothetical protein
MTWSGPPSAALAAARSAVEAAGGAVVDARLFSDLHLHLAVELDAAGAAGLIAALEAASLRVDDEAGAALCRAAAGPAGSELHLALGIRMSQGQGDVQQTIPAVPG